jgi:ATP-binding cassette, subfamily B, bacterial
MTSYGDLFAFVWGFILRKRWLFLTILILDCIFFTGDALVWPYILNVVIEIFGSFEGDRLAAFASLKYPIIAGITLFFVVEAGSRVMGMLMAHAIPWLQEAIRMTLFDHIQHHSPKYFNERFSGSLANKISDMTNETEEVVGILFFPVLPSLSTFFFGLLFLGWINFYVALMLFIWAAAHMATCFYFSSRIGDLEHAHGEARTELMGKIVDSLTNNFVVNLFYSFSRENNFIQCVQNTERTTNVKTRRHVEFMRVALSIIYGFGVLLGIYGTMIYLWLHNLISTGDAVQVFTSMTSLSILLWTMSSWLPNLFQAIGTMRQAYSVIREPQDLGDLPQAKPLNVQKGKIEFHDVSFHYGERRLFENKHVTIQGGERVGLVGYTGAGKSSFVNLILRLFPVEKGKITIDGQNVAEVTLESLRNQIALIPQDPLLFHRTIRENILYGRPSATEEELQMAIKLAHCDPFIQKLPQGLETKVGERGTKLSGGEKQRIAIARAILKNSPIVMMDEATSALDSITEQYIQDSLESIMNRHTTIVIAHRLSTLSKMDRILVFDQGHIVEEGSHLELLRKEGHYAHMWKMQAGGFLPERPV